jgi:hypothetical protein
MLARPAADEYLVTVRSPLVVLMLAVALSGCGGSRHITPPRALNHRERIETACGDLRARLNGIADQTAVISGSPSDFVGRAQARRLEQATRESVSALYETAEALERLTPRFSIRSAVSEAIEGYDRYSQTLPTRAPRSAKAGIRLTGDYLRIKDTVDVACREAAMLEPTT